jgi:hypothetical protein
MTLPESSAEPERTENPLLTFTVTVVLLIGAFYAMRKYVGTVPALIAVYLAYVYRKDLIKELKEMIEHVRH